MNHSIWKIIAKNTFTLFNLVNVILAIMVASVGSFKNMLFIGVAIANTLISVINEIRAKKIVDKMRLLAEQKPTVLKNGKPIQVAPEAVQKGDVIILSLGDQVLYDSITQSGQIEVNESLITGEQDPITKHSGDQLTSGSFVVSGTATAKVVRIGADNFVNKLQQEASYVKTADAKLFKIMNNIVKYISWTLIPIGALLLWARFRTEVTPESAITSTVAALINMLPEGLILLTSSVLALATIRLSKKKVLVQDLYSIETLARVDTICLDKTGTLTTGRMTVHDFTLPNGETYKKPSESPTPVEKSFESALNAILTHQTSENATISALKKTFARTIKNHAINDFPKITEVISFSSDRKCSGVKTKNATYLLGAIEFVTDDESLIKQVKSVSGTYRTLAIVKCGEGVADNTFSGSLSRFSSSETYIPDGPARNELPKANRFARKGGSAGVPAYDVEDEKVRSQKGMSVRTPSPSCLLGIIRLEDEIRPTAHQIINYFYANDIAVKIISGDDIESVKSIAKKVGVRDLRAFNLASEKKHNYSKLVQNYSIFTRVTPSEKKSLIAAFKKQGNTVAMTGDGVNDILAMKEADVSLAIGEGSDAARRASKIVLLDSGFEAVPAIIDEGRQTINNLERSASFFLTKTVYAGILAVLFTFLPLSYPYTPIEMSLLNAVCITLPGLALALEHNTARIKNKFVSNIKHYAVPAGITVAVSMVTLSVVAHNLNLPKNFLTTLSAAITSGIGLVLTYQISKPLNLFRTLILIAMAVIILAALLLPLTRTFFEFI